MNSVQRRIIRPWCWIALLPAIAAPAQAGDLLVQFPKDMNVSAAEASAAPQPPVAAQIQPGQAKLINLDPQQRYDIKLTLQDGTIFQGVDMSWENADPADPDAGDLTDDDRQQMTAILNIPSFYNHSDILRLLGNHDRAVALVQLVRDQPFAGDTGQEVICRVELWYFKNEHGGWVKLDNRILRRQRFQNPDQFQQAISKLHWIPELGGISVPATGAITLTLPPDAAATQPAAVSGH